MSPITLRPSNKYPVKLYLTVLLIFAFLVFPWVFLGFIPDLGWVYVLIFMIVNALWLIPTLILIPPYCRSIVYELGDEELLVRKGIITRSEKTVPYRMITNTDLKRGPLDRALGIGGIAIQTAGYSQQTSPEAKLAGLDDYAGTQRQLQAVLRRYRALTGAREAEGPAAGSEALLGQILEELRALRQEMQARG
jgi:membrane protein YdbS with pleckstrin-like domain